MTSQPGPLTTSSAFGRSGDPALLARVLSLSLILAVLLNGASIYLKRTGVIDQDAYQAYWTVHCPFPGEPGRPGEPAAPAKPRCCADAPPSELAGMSPEQVAKERAMAAFVYQATGAEVALKLVKDFLGIAIFLVSLHLLARGAFALPTPARQWPLYLLAGYVLVAVAVAMAQGEFTGAAAGARAFIFLAIALTGPWLSPHAAIFAGGIGVLLLVEALLVPFEIFSGIHLHGHLYGLPLAGRAAATLALPNSLGAFAVIGLAFHHAYAAVPRLRLLGAVSLALVLASGSGTGLACTMLFWFLLLFERAAPRRRLLIAGAGVLVALAAAAALPDLMGRPRLYESVFGKDGAGGRLQTLRDAAADRSLASILLGGHIGKRSNTALNLERGGSGPSIRQDSIDSTVTSLFIQLGAVGTLLFYLVLAWAACRDPAARKFYATVAAASLTLNITELFPANYLLGIALAHGTLSGRRA